MRVVSSTEQVVDAVQQAVRQGKRIAVRSGGHILGGGYSALCPAATAWAWTTLRPSRSWW
ncbi:hypothetical protein V7793_01630 [Streptomyces sp. KLMMK]|uniref:hypothetical protein n=1 Tax=Streptomyces sp. KLMMK TaxID=3109353 RepID=UPI002FFDEDEA